MTIYDDVLCAKTLIFAKKISGIDVDGGIVSVLHREQHPVIVFAGITINYAAI